MLIKKLINIPIISKKTSEWEKFISLLDKAKLHISYLDDIVSLDETNRLLAKLPQARSCNYVRSKKTVEVNYGSSSVTEKLTWFTLSEFYFYKQLKKVSAGYIEIYNLLSKDNNHTNASLSYVMHPG